VTARDPPRRRVGDRELVRRERVFRQREPAKPPRRRIRARYPIAIMRFTRARISASRMIS
jgi:hypothetical protein